MSAGRMNIDVTATTGKFAAQMKRVRAEMATTARAAGKGFSIGGMGRLGGPLGAVGESVGVLSGPMLALVAGLAGLSVAMKSLEQRVAAGRENLSEMRLLGMGLEEQANAKRLATIIRPDGTGADAVGLADKFAEVAPEFGLGTMKGLSLEEKIRQAMIAAKGQDALRIAEQMGGKAGEDFMRLRMVDPGLFAAQPTNAGAAIEAFVSERARQADAASNDPNNPSMIRDFFQAIGQYLLGVMAERDMDISPVTREEALQQLRQMNNGLRAVGPGI
jgi:hypothetical protein